MKWEQPVRYLLLQDKVTDQDRRHRLGAMGMTELVQCLPNMEKKWRGGERYTPVIPAFWRQRQEDQMVKVIPG